MSVYDQCESEIESEIDDKGETDHDEYIPSDEELISHPTPRKWPKRRDVTNLAGKGQALVSKNAVHHNKEDGWEVRKIISERHARSGDREYKVVWADSWLEKSELQGSHKVEGERRAKSGAQEFKVVWKDSWVTENDLEGAKELLEEFKAELHPQGIKLLRNRARSHAAAGGPQS